jgi:hypothetical protein
MTAMSNYSFRAKESYSFLASPFIKFNTLASKRKNKEPKCWCFYGWICEDHPDKPWGHKECGAAADLCKNPQCVKIRTPFFYQSTPIVQPGRRKPPVRKTELLSPQSAVIPIRDYR